ncbi:MAG TPA: hydrogenase maturation protease, partial [bacterium]|nr:hydrogenase maturation protease [bacterium]
IIEVGTETWKIFPEAENFENLLIIDAVKFGNYPGTVYFIKNFEISSLPYFSLHQKDFIKEIFLIKELKGKPRNVYLFGIEPESIGWGIGLSESLERKFEQIQEKLERVCFMILKGAENVIY